MTTTTDTVRRTATVLLGRDGIGADANDAWVSFVAAHIDALTGLDVSVDARDGRDVQIDYIRVDETEDSDPTEDREMVTDALSSLWEDWCGLSVDTDEL
jgi:hypothetical protein